MNRPYLFGDILGPEALPARMLLGAIAGAVIGVCGLLVALVRLTQFVVFNGPSRLQSHGAEVTGFLLTFASLYLGAFMVAGIVLGVLAGFRRGLIVSAFAGFFLGATLYGGVALGDPDAHGSFLSRLAEAREIAIFMGKIWAGVGVIWYLSDRWKHRRTAV